ncbi:MAG: zinc carboxypeptidase [Elusimicrobia bacterium]|nr:zinc carboxypeptidase [Elusimicrobiota bacterium]
MQRVWLAAALALCSPSAALAAPDGYFDGRSAAEVELPRPPATAPAAAGLDSRLWIVVRAPTKQARTAVADTGISIEQVYGDRVGGIGTRAMIDRLKEQGLAPIHVSELDRLLPADFPPEDQAYHNYQELRKELEAIAARAPGLASIFVIGHSHQNREILALRLNTDAAGRQKSGKPAIAFMGTHHAREHLSTEVPLMLAAYLVDKRNEPEISALLSRRDIFILPMINPDGVEHDISGGFYRMHRKNMRENGRGSIGVDLNRNYGFHWGEGGASDRPDSDIYRGPAPFSEPETQAVKSFVEERKDTIKILLSYHTFSELILYPWGHSYDPIPDAEALAAYRAMAGTMGRMTGYTPQQSSELYIASGDTTDWAWGAHRIFSFTFELTPKTMWDGGFYPGADAINTTFNNNIRPALYLIELADDPYRAARTLSQTQLKPTPVSGGR